jgi:hypothetical protein
VLLPIASLINNLTTIVTFNTKVMIIRLECSDVALSPKLKMVIAVKMPAQAGETALD